MGMKCVYFNKEVEEIIENNFSKGKWGEKLFSKIVSDLLIKYLDERPTIDNLNKKKEEVQKEIQMKEKELEEIENKYHQLVDEEKSKFNITINEAKFLNDTPKIFGNQRVSAYKNIFKKNVTYKEFLRLLKIAKKEYPSANGFVEERDE